LFAFICLAYTSVSAEPKRTSDKDQQTIKRLEEEMIAFLLKNDIKKLETYMVKDAVSVTDDGQIQHGEEAFKELQSGALKLTKIDLDSIEVRTFGDAAIAVLVTTEEGSLDGKQFSGKWVSTDVFRRTGSDWKIVSSQITKVLRR
jgi:uncharacterized protein (TIGR02246 family)